MLLAGTTVGTMGDVLINISAGGFLLAFVALALSPIRCARVPALVG